jgi:type IV secretory pathway TraG/TraD family ATPase VirD4
LSSFGTYIIGAVKGVETTKYLSEMIGRKRIRVYTPSFSDTGDGRLTRSDTYQEQDRAVISPDVFSRQLGANENGARLLIFTGDDYVYMLDAKHLTSNQKKELRAPTLPADWLAPGFPTAQHIAEANQRKKQAEKEMEKNNEE